MSKGCIMRSEKLAHLQPKFVEFTEVKGVLKILPQGESSKGQGLIFLCPRCRTDKSKSHYCIFLFPNSPEKARPQGRFVMSLLHHKKILEQHTKWERVCLFELNAFGSGRMLLRPQDVCGWEGYVSDGTVSWRPNAVEVGGM